MFQPLIVIYRSGILCIIIGIVHQFIDHCLIPLDPWITSLKCFRKIKLVIVSYLFGYTTNRVLTGTDKLTNRTAYSVVLLLQTRVICASQLFLFWLQCIFCYFHLLIIMMLYDVDKLKLEIIGFSVNIFMLLVCPFLATLFV